MTLRRSAAEAAARAALLALLPVGAALSPLAAWREARAKAAHPPEGRLVDVGGVPVHAVVRGTGPDLVLIHGASGNARDWTMDFADKVDRRFRVIAFDRPGLGHTGHVDPSHGRAVGTRAASPAEQAALLAAAAARLGARKPIVLGHSYGGAVALAWALDHPCAAAVILSGVSHPWKGGLGPLPELNGSRLGGAALVPVLAAATPRRAVAAAVRGVFAPDPVPENYAVRLRAALTLRRASLRANARQLRTLKPHMIAMAPRYGGLTVPVEIVHGTADTIVPPSVHAEPLARAAPGSRLTMLPGIGHMPHHAAPDAVAAAIDRAAARAGLAAA